RCNASAIPAMPRGACHAAAPFEFFRSAWNWRTPKEKEPRATVQTRKGLPATRPHILHMQFANPNIAKAHQIFVILQGEGQFLRVRRIRRTLSVRGWPRKLGVVLNEHSVVQHGHARGTKQFSILVETRPMKN